jgi:hypothetical protein
VTSSPSPPIQALLDYWRQKRGSRLVPARASIDPVEFSQHLPYVFLGDIIDQGVDLRCRLVGGTAGEYIGGEKPGCRASELGCRPFSEILVESCRDMIAKNAPVLILLQFSFLIEPAVQVELLLMPLSSNGELADIVFGMIEVNSDSWTISPTLEQLYARASSVEKTIVEL